MFLIIVIALVVVTMARLSSVQHGTSSLAIQQARAYQAARAGLEWGIARAVNAGLCSDDARPSMAGSNLAGFTVTVSCAVDSPDDEAGMPVQIFRITAEAENGSPGSRGDYAFRRLLAVVER